MTITIELTDHEYEKLTRLAKAKRRTIAGCIKAFAQSCQPGGGGWYHPSLSSPTKARGAGA